jgi:hypothetical protein
MAAAWIRSGVCFDAVLEYKTYSGDRPERDRKKTRTNKLPEDSSSDETLWCGERKRKRRRDGVMEKGRIRRNKLKNCVNSIWGLFA